MYQVDQAVQQKRTRRRRWPWVLLVIVLLLIGGGWWLSQQLKPDTVLKQSSGVTAKVAYANKIKHYDETDFGIDMPSDWIKQPQPLNSYQSYTWKSPDISAGSQVIEIFEDTIPVNYATNHALIVSNEIDHVVPQGNASEKCNTFTKNASDGSANTPVPAKWQDVDFICDRSTTTRDSIATSSKDGVNKVILKSPTTGATHSFFFTYVNYSINPDYTLFYSALSSFKMQ